MGKIYLRTPEYTDENGTYGRLFHDQKTLRIDNKEQSLVDGSLAMKIASRDPSQSMKIMSSDSREFINLCLGEMPTTTLAWIWTTQPKFRPGDTVQGFVVIRERLNPYIMAIRKSRSSGLIRLVNSDSGEIIKAQPVVFAPMVSQYTLDTSEHMPTGPHSVEVLDKDGRVIGATPIEITRFEKKELLVRLTKIPRYILVGDEAQIEVEGRYFHGAAVATGKVTVEREKGNLIEVELQNGNAKVILSDLDCGKHEFTVTLRDDQDRVDSTTCELIVAEQPAFLRVFLPKRTIYSGLPVDFRVRLESPDGLPLSNYPLKIKITREGRLKTSDVAPRHKVIPTNVNGYIDLSERFEHAGTYTLEIETTVDGEKIASSTHLQVERLVEGHLFLEHALDKQIFQEGEKITGKVRVSGHPDTITKVKYGYLDLISDRLIETKRVNIDDETLDEAGAREISYAFEGVTDFYGPISVEFYVNNQTQKLGLVETDKLDLAGCLVAGAQAIVEFPEAIEVDLSVDSPESTPTGSTITLKVNVDSTLLTEEFWIFGALIDERILTPQHDLNITRTFLTPPDPLKLLVKESHTNLPPLPTMAPAGAGGGIPRGGFFPKDVLFGAVPGADILGAEVMEVASKTDETSGWLEKDGSVPDLEDFHAPELILRTNFAESVILAPVRVQDGKGIFEITVPDAVTTFRIAVFGMGEMQCGQVSQSLVVKNPVFTQILNAAEMVLQDELDIRCIVQNTTSEPITGAEVMLHSEKNLSFSGESRIQTLDIDPNAANLVTWNMRATGVGPANIELELATPKFSEVSTLDQPLYVVPPGQPAITRTQSYIEEGKPLVLEWSVTGTEAYTLGVVNCLPAMELAVIEGLEALAKYPYGCCEQTSASTMPNIIVYEYLSAADKLSEVMVKKLVHNMQAGLQRYLTIFRGPDGGFGLWNGENTSVFHTGLALSVIGRMRPYLKGIPENVFSKGLEYLARHKKEGHWASEMSLETPFPSTLSDPAMTAYLLHGLALGGIQDEGAFQWMVEHLPDYREDPTTLALILETWARGETYHSQFPEFGPSIREILLNSAKRDSSLVFWNMGSALTSQIESTAYVLIALATAFPKDSSFYELLQNGLDYLLEHRQVDGWNSTRDTLYASMAIAKVATAGKSEFELRVSLNGKVHAKETVSPDNMAWKIFDLRNMYLDDLLQGDNALRVELKGTGKCHVVCELRKWFFEAQPIERELPVTVTRIVSSPQVTIDEEIMIEITCTPQEAVDALLIEQPIPALLAFPEETVTRLEGELEHIEVNQKTDRTTIAVFYSHLEPGETVRLSLPFKAAFSGKCRVEPTQVCGMYDPDQRVEVPPVEIRCE